MVNREEKLTADQGDLFLQLGEHTPAFQAENAPDLFIEPELRGALAYCLREAKKHGLSRERVLERMNLCLPEEKHVTLRQLNGWLAASAEDRPFPAEMLPAFVWAVRGIVAPVEVITRVLGLHVMDEQEAMAAELGETILTKARATQRERLLRKQLGRD